MKPGGADRPRRPRLSPKPIRWPYDGLTLKENWRARNSQGCLVYQLKAQGPPSLLLPDGRAIHRITTRGDVIEAQRDDATAAELAVNGQVEESKVALSIRL